MDFCFVYVLRSMKDGLFYTGFTRDLNQRFRMHNGGSVESTKDRTPFELVYFEGCRNEKDALHRERYLKSTYGKRYIGSRLKYYLQPQTKQ